MIVGRRNFDHISSDNTQTLERAQEAKSLVDPAAQQRHREGAEINTSLLALKECIRAMSVNAKHVAAVRCSRCITHADTMEKALENTRKNMHPVITS